MAEKTALVTGGAGFVGSHLVERLLEQGWRVISLDNYVTGLEDNHIPGAEYRRGHTRDVGNLIPEVPDVIFHLGEYARVEASLTEPQLVWEHNLTGTPALLEWWHTHAPHTPFIYAGSSTRFATGEDGSTLTPYTFAKSTMAQLVRCYGKWYHLPWAIGYLYNVYGPREPAGARGTVVARFLAQRKADQPLTVVAPGTQRRHFTFVKDAVEGLLLIAEKGVPGEYHVCSEEEFSILELAELIGGPITMLPPRKGNREASVGDPSSLRALGWRPTTSLRDYLAAELWKKREV
jgi:UDP-glucose 4-epimerase